MKFTSILFVAACVVLTVSAAPCTDKSHKKNFGKKHINYNEEYNIDKTYNYHDNSNIVNKSINQSNGDTGNSSGKGIGLNLGGIGSKTDTKTSVDQTAVIN